MKIIFSLVVLLLINGAEPLFAAENASASPYLLSKVLADLQNQEAVMLTVNSEPGAASMLHRHNADTFVYMLEGSMIMAVAGGEEVTLHPGDTFYESRTDVHAVSRNASNTEPAKFLVFIIKDRDAPISVMLP